MVTPPNVTNVALLAAGYHSALALERTRPPGPRVDHAVLAYCEFHRSARLATSPSGRAVIRSARE